jgi:hypothetical protein
MCQWAIPFILWCNRGYVEGNTRRVDRDSWYVDRLKGKAAGSELRRLFVLITQHENGEVEEDGKAIGDDNDPIFFADTVDDPQHQAGEQYQHHTDGNVFCFLFLYQLDQLG